MAAEEVSVCVKCPETATCRKRGSCGQFQCMSGYCDKGTGGTPIDPDNPQPACPDEAYYDTTKKKCVCNAAAYAGRCGSTWMFFNRNGDHCACEQATCPSGQYPTGFDTDTGDVVCVACPTSDLSSLTCTIGSSIDDANIPVNFAGGKEYNGCYLPANCTAKDTTGTFTVGSKCKHVVDNSMSMERN